MFDALIPLFGTLVKVASPTLGGITDLFKVWDKLPKDQTALLLKFMDEEQLAKLASWAETFSARLNDLGPSAVNAELFDAAAAANLDGEFEEVMGGTKYVGPKLTAEDLAKASNAITKAIKASNWLEAIQVGIGLAGGGVPA